MYIILFWDHFHQIEYHIQKNTVLSPLYNQLLGFQHLNKALETI